MLLEKYLDKRRKVIDKALGKYLDGADEMPKTIHEAMRYSIFAGGHRMRPLLMIATYEMLRGRRDIRAVRRILPAACAIEMIHTASLIHDDLPSIDNSDERRGRPSCHKKFGNAMAILTGDALITKSIETMMEINNKKQSLQCLQLLIDSSSTRGMIGGQVIEIVTSQKKRVKLHMVRDIHLKKTGALLKGAIQMGCILNDAEEQTRNSLGDFALNLGLAYQVIDDILDQIGAGAVLHKQTGEDMRNRKVTYPVLLGVEESKKRAAKLLDDAENIIKYMDGNEVLVEYIETIRDRIP